MKLQWNILQYVAAVPLDAVSIGSWKGKKKIGMGLEKYLMGVECSSVMCQVFGGAVPNLSLCVAAVQKKVKMYKYLSIYRTYKKKFLDGAPEQLRLFCIVNCIWLGDK